MYVYKDKDSGKYNTFLCPILNLLSWDSYGAPEQKKASFPDNPDILGFTGGIPQTQIQYSYHSRVPSLIC